MDFVDGICMATRPPIDRGGQIVSQTWTAVFDFAVPSDLRSNECIDSDRFQLHV